MTQPVPVFERPIDAEVRPPGSKSETIRALAAAALADGRSHLYAPLYADDTEAMTGAVQQFGVAVGSDVEPMWVDGRGGRLDAPSRTIDARESGLSARILIAMAASLDGTTTIVGRGRLPERPMGGIVAAMRSLGTEVSGESLPLTINGRGRLWGGDVVVDCSLSSQFATAVMLVAPVMREPCHLEVTGLRGSEGYLDMTAATMRRFGAEVERTVTGYEIENNGYRASDVVIEPDASAAVYPMGIAAVTAGRVTIEGLGADSVQPDIRMAEVLEAMGCRVERHASRVEISGPAGGLRAVDVDMSDAPDASLAVAAVALFADGVSRIRGLGSLRHKESDRLAAIEQEITRVGGVARVEDDTLSVEPGALHGAEINPHGDHRIAMAMAIVGTKVAGLSVADPHVVDKTWPGFWDLLGHLDG